MAIAQGAERQYTDAPMNSKHFLFALSIVVLWGAGPAAAQDLSGQVSAAWKDRVFVLKQCCAKNLTFNEQGELLSPPPRRSGPTAVAVESVKLKKDALEVRAERLNFSLVPPGLDIASPWKDTLRVTIKLGGAPNSADGLNAAMQRVFIHAASNADLLPAYMQACARGQILRYQGLWRCELAGVWSRDEEIVKAMKSSDKYPVPGEVLDFTLVDGRYVPEKVPAYAAAKSITPPKPIATPDPEYSETARRNKINASLALRVVISDQGTPEHIQVIAPAGYGLDDRAVAAVSKWRFKPATFRGQPVPVGVTIEVNFRTW